MINYCLKIIIATLSALITMNVYACAGIEPLPVKALSEYPGTVGGESAIGVVYGSTKKVLNCCFHFPKSNIKIHTPQTAEPVSKISFDLSNLHAPKGMKFMNIYLVVREDLRIYDMDHRLFTTNGFRFIGKITPSDKIKEFSLFVSLVEEYASIVMFVGYKDLQTKNILYSQEIKKIPIQRGGMCPFGAVYAFTNKDLERFKIIPSARK